MVMVGSTAWRNKATGKVCETPKVDVWRFRDGKAVEYCEYYDTAKMLQAASWARGTAALRSVAARPRLRRLAQMRSSASGRQRTKARQLAEAAIPAKTDSVNGRARPKRSPRPVTPGGCRIGGR